MGSFGHLRFKKVFRGLLGLFAFYVGIWLSFRRLLWGVYGSCGRVRGFSRCCLGAFGVFAELWGGSESFVWPYSHWAV